MHLVRLCLLSFTLAAVPALAQSAGKARCEKTCDQFVKHCEVGCKKAEPKAAPYCAGACKQQRPMCMTECMVDADDGAAAPPEEAQDDDA